jgi:hypothetical protein
MFVPDRPGERFSDRPFGEFMKALRDFLRVSHVISYIWSIPTDYVAGAAPKTLIAV